METANQITVTKSEELVAREAMAKAQFDLTPMGQMLRQFEAQQRMGQMFAQSKIVPANYQNNVADCSIAIDMAMRMNCNPLTVMQNLVIVQGRPTWQAQFLIACINQSGRFTTLQYRQETDGMVGKVEYEDNEWDSVNRRNKLVKRTFDGTNVPNYTCQAFATDLKTGEIIYGAEISVRMAVLERWYTKSGSKWQTMPRQMLIYRAASFFQRAYCPEIGMGFHTTEEEIDRAPEVIDAEATPMPAARKSLTDIAAVAASQEGTERPSEAQSLSNPSEAQSLSNPSEAQLPSHHGEVQPDQPSPSKKTLL
jgi:hypothetical protein